MPNGGVCVREGEVLFRRAKDTAVGYLFPAHLASDGIWDNDFGLILTLKG